ncbi:hypothetical protein V6C03_07390 [Methyloligella sp. 2.7D]|uniref:hypothetical protein n=1 Tax=unclassified Methyloligella TaxID=2625955 RepID=UPI00157C98B5|nr:hypothetical protein [Methyloligella sp. GL2]QKP78291.1 hypothetical protein HT051_13055 [Methyloligella sp. GL2]
MLKYLLLGAAALGLATLAPVGLGAGKAEAASATIQVHYNNWNRGYYRGQGYRRGYGYRRPYYGYRQPYYGYRYRPRCSYQPAVAYWSPGFAFGAGNRLVCR